MPGNLASCPFPAPTPPKGEILEDSEKTITSFCLLVFTEFLAVQALSSHELYVFFSGRDTEGQTQWERRDETVLARPLTPGRTCRCRPQGAGPPGEGEEGGEGRGDGMGRGEGGAEWCGERGEQKEANWRVLDTPR